MKVIIDGNNFAFRPMVAQREPLINVNNENVTCIHGVIALTISLIRQFDIDEITFCWDAGRSKERLEICPDYKGNRKPTEAGATVKWSMPILQEALSAFGVKQVKMPGVEADDIIYVISQALTGVKKDVMIISGDKDILQSLTPFCSVYSFARSKEINLSNFQQVVGVPFRGFLDYLCMLGDDSDNIAGIDGIGETTAKKLIQKYGNLEGIFAKEEEIRMLANFSNPEKLVAKKAISLFSDEGKKRMARNRKMIKLGELITHDQKKQILTDYAMQTPKVNEAAMLEFFNRYHLAQFARTSREVANCFGLLEPMAVGAFR